MKAMGSHIRHNAVKRAPVSIQIPHDDLNSTSTKITNLQWMGYSFLCSSQGHSPKINICLEGNGVDSIVLCAMAINVSTTRCELFNV